MLQNQKALEALKLKLSLLSGADSSKELAAAMRESSKEFYSKGASWNGQAVIVNGLIVAVVALIAYAVWFHSTHKCVEWRETNEIECTSDVLYSDFDTTVYGPTTCDYKQVCAEYVKR